jgi:hypothetical protein
MIDHNDNDKDIVIDRKLVDVGQFLEVITTKNVFIESVECGGMKVLSKEIFIEGDIISHGPIILAATQIHVVRLQ